MRGSSRGLGAGIALALAQAGVDVTIHGSRAVPESTPQRSSASDYVHGHALVVDGGGLSR